MASFKQAQGSLPPQISNQLALPDNISPPVFIEWRPMRSLSRLTSPMRLVLPSALLQRACVVFDVLSDGPALQEKDVLVAKWLPGRQCLMNFLGNVFNECGDEEQCPDQFPENLWHQLKWLGLDQNDENHCSQYLLKEKLTGPKGRDVMYA
ncbi:hypothetical protein BAE44_0012129 [Dichanthelium oligosanthes]|uniref:Uncharacterized protein n=1 Tax=Dichanthelium oligosanthes TaxID=888268 RepID=A0A1E5VNY7_9POAL|nr:hypothetical protein BAE44_0012129 [Dichanthelium oligosanthes]